MRRRYLEDDGCFLECERCLSGELVRESIVPREGDPDLRETEFEKLQLAKVFVQQVSSYNISVSGITTDMQSTRTHLSYRFLLLEQHPAYIVEERRTRLRTCLGSHRTTAR